MTKLRKCFMGKLKIRVLAVITKTYFFKLRPISFLPIFGLFYKNKLLAYEWLLKKTGPRKRSF